MTTLKNKQGMGMITMLGIVIFLLAAVGTALTFVVNDAFSINRDVVNKTEYSSAINAVDSVVGLMRPVLVAGTAIDKDSTYWQGVQTATNVSITTNEFGYRVSRAVGDREVAAYITFSGRRDTVLYNTKAKLENLPQLRVVALLDSYIDSFFGLDHPPVATFNEKVAYMGTQILADSQISPAGSQGSYITPSQYPKSSQLTVNTFVNGSLSVKNGNNEISMVNISHDNILVINGDLEIDRNGANITGNVIVKGNLIIKNNVNIIGTLFVGGSVSVQNGATIGFVSNDPNSSTSVSYLFAQGNINIGNVSTLMGFILSDNNITIGNSANLTGGVYSHSSEPTVGGQVTPATLDEELILNNDMGQVFIDNSTVTTEPVVLSVRARLE